MKVVKFKVTTTPVTDINRQQEYVIDGVKAPKLFLQVGKTYIFELDTPQQPFYITTDAIGGTNKLKNFCQSVYHSGISPGVEKYDDKKGEENQNEKDVEEKQQEKQGENQIEECGKESGSITLIPKKEHVNMKLYYQSDKSRLMGQRIIVFEEKTY